MDTSDPAISFNAGGVCDHCHSYDANVAPHWRLETSTAELDQMAAEIKKHSRGEFDCVLGLSGGLDSSYLAHVAVVDMGLKPLVFHVDGGWNSDVATRNIENIVSKLGLELFTEVINWKEMQDFQLALFKSGVPHVDLAQDHAFVATLYNFCLKEKLGYILNGGNFSTECVQNPLKFFYYGTDMVHLRDIRKKFAKVPFDTYPTSGILRHKVYLRYIKRIRVVKPLNEVRYIRSEAIDFLRDEYDYEYYGQKHFESRFTRFYEGYWLPTRFGFDTRRVQFSSLILTGQMSREDAVAELEKPPYDEDTIQEDIQYVATKLDITVAELMAMHAAPPKFYYDYRNTVSMFKVGAKVLNKLGIERAIRR